MKLKECLEHIAGIWCVGMAVVCLISFILFLLTPILVCFWPIWYTTGLYAAYIAGISFILFLVVIVFAPSN